MKTTSIEAHNSIKPDKAKMHRLILSGLRKIGQGSFRDIATAAGLREAQVWKRLSELKEQNLIYEADEKQCPVSGIKVTVWKLKTSNNQLDLF